MTTERGGRPSNDNDDYDDSMDERAPAGLTGNEGEVQAPCSATRAVGRDRHEQTMRCFDQVCWFMIGVATAVVHSFHGTELAGRRAAPRCVGDGNTMRSNVAKCTLNCACQ